jgi:hypothetical protein
MLPDPTQVLKTLAKRRPIFHSEADFQHAFAWEILGAEPRASLRLELPVRTANRNVYLDLLAEHEHQRCAVELKYKTAKLDACLGSEQFSLRGQSAQDCGRYDFLSDVRRLEDFVMSAPGTGAVGYAILLSNDRLYWQQSGRSNLSKHFSIYEGREIVPGDKMQWVGGYTKGREQPISCQFRYSCAWSDYSTIPPNGPMTTNGCFKYLLLTVRAETGC